MRAAARAGIQEAASAAPTSSTPVASNTWGSSGETLYSRLSIQRVSTAAAPRPAAVPPAVAYRSLPENQADDIGPRGADGNTNAYLAHAPGNADSATTA